jgi:hypothetical protein
MTAQMLKKPLPISNQTQKFIIIMALQPFVGPWQLFKFLDPTHSQQGSFDGGSARRKASTYTQNNTNTG